MTDILDLDFLLSQDEKQESVAHPDRIAARDRDIFRQMDRPDADDSSLLLGWLTHRKQRFFDETGGSGRLPGAVYSRLIRFLTVLSALAGVFLGLGLAYTFLAYHGIRPVNVTLFFAIFILVPAGLFLLTLAGLLLRWSGRRLTTHTALWALAFNGLPRLLKKTGWSVSDMEMVRYVASLMDRKTYRRLFFWPVFTLASLFAACFSLGALGGTLFRVTVSDVAFGWQSTILTQSSRVQELVAAVALPWSAWLPRAVPTPADIEGSRIILKQGIASLTQAHLVSWWPFLCMGMLCYAVLPRLVLILAARRARESACGAFDAGQPRLRRLILRMKSPVMDIRSKEKPVSRAVRENPMDFREKIVTQPQAPPPPPPPPAEPVVETIVPEASAESMGTGVLLAPASVFGEAEEFLPLIREQFLLEIDRVIPVTLDPATDTDLLAALKTAPSDLVILLQEVWQPPIRGLLHYLVQLKQGVLAEKTLWVLLTQTPGEAALAVEEDDTDFQVWQQTVFRLEEPDLLVERIRP